MRVFSYRDIVWNIIIIVTSILAGVLAALAFSSGAIVFMINILKAVLVLSVLIYTEYTTVAILSYFIKNSKIKSCLTGPGKWLLISDLGAIVTAILSLGFCLIPGSLSSAVLTGVNVFFFSWMILSDLFFAISLAEKTKPFNDF